MATESFLIQNHRKRLVSRIFVSCSIGILMWLVWQRDRLRDGGGGGGTGGITANAFVVVLFLSGFGVLKSRSSSTFFIDVVNPVRRGCLGCYTVLYFWTLDRKYKHTHTSRHAIPNTPAMTHSNFQEINSKCHSKSSLPSFIQKRIVV